MRTNQVRLVAMSPARWGLLMSIPEPPHAHCTIAVSKSGDMLDLLPAITHSRAAYTCVRRRDILVDMCPERFYIIPIPDAVVCRCPWMASSIVLEAVKIPTMFPLGSRNQAP